MFREMRTIAIACLLLVAAGLSAQSLDGTWVSTEPILLNLKFSMAFSEPDSYLIDCTLGKTIGTYYTTLDRIHFTPTTVGINSGDAGKSDTWAYHFIDADTFTLSSGAVSVRLLRRK
jgi:hypothetical protein